MRVISGSARGLKLLSLEGLDTRPTLDRVKEALFSMLTPYINSSNVLDLFAGSGALGIEALSRGANKAVFVDSLPSAMAIVKENVKKARLENSALFFQKDACDFLKHCDLKFDIVFLDPPYSGNFYESCLKGLCENNLLNTEGVVAMEWESELSRPAIPPCYEVVKERRYGRVMITLLTLSEKGATNG